MTRRLSCLIIIAFLCIVCGCSGSGDNAIAPVEPTLRNVESTNSHMLWGLYQFTADPVAQTLEAVPLRMADMHLNALPFLEPPVLVYMTLETIQFNGNIIETDIGLRHPFLGLTEFTGFDVCGTLITNGSVTGFDNPDIRIAGAGDTRLLNPDGATRWWNPSEFPNGGTIFGYTDGLLGSPDSSADFNCTVNGYKYFCDDLIDPDDGLSEVTLEDRGMFNAGQKNIRHYTIELGTEGLVFNYAIDASWSFPTGGPPWTAPDDFPEGANRPEAWWIDVDITGNTFWNDGVNSGGGLLLTVDVYDWFNTEPGLISVESPGNFDPVMDVIPSGGGEGYSTYEIEIISSTPAYGQINVLISTECEDEGFGGFIPDEHTTAYQVLNVDVSEELIELNALGSVEFYPYFDGFGPDDTEGEPVATEWLMQLDGSASTGSVAQYHWEIDGDDLFDDASGVNVVVSFPETGTHLIKLKVTDGGVNENIYEFPGTYEVRDGTYVWAAFTGMSDGSRDNPYTSIPDAINATATDAFILVRGDDGSLGQNTHEDDLDLGSEFNGSHIQGYYGDNDAGQPPLQTGYVKITGDNITFDGFEVTGTSQADYQPFGWDSKLGVQQGQNVRFRHIYLHDISPHTYGDGLVSWDGATMIIQNCLITEFDMVFFIVNRTHHNYAHTEMINCTFDRLSSGEVWGWYNAGYGTSSVNNCIWTDIGSGSGTRYLIRDGAGTYTITYNNCCDTPTLPDGGQYYILNTGPHTPFEPDPGTGCITEDPLYVDPFTDHHLDTGSPCIDTGDPAILDPDSSISDMGCYGGPCGDWDFEN